MPKLTAHKFNRATQDSPEIAGVSLVPHLYRKGGELQTSLAPGTAYAMRRIKPLNNQTQNQAVIKSIANSHQKRISNIENLFMSAIRLKPFSVPLHARSDAPHGDAVPGCKRECIRSELRSKLIQLHLLSRKEIRELLHVVKKHGPSDRSHVLTGPSS